MKCESNIVLLGEKKKLDEAWIVLEFLHGGTSPFSFSFLLCSMLSVIYCFLMLGTLKRASQSHHFSDNHVAFVAREIFNGLNYLHSRVPHLFDLRLFPLHSNVCGGRGGSIAISRAPTSCLTLAASSNSVRRYSFQVVHSLLSISHPFSSL